MSSVIQLSQTVLLYSNSGLMNPMYSFTSLVASCGFSTIMYRLVSSTKNLIEMLIFMTILLIDTRNSKGPKIEPFGTPASTSVQLDA